METTAELLVEEEEIPDEEDCLLFSANPGPRIFVTCNMNVDSIIGLVLDESDDSFLVALPARMAELDQKDSEEKITIMLPFIKAPYIRLLKANVGIVSYLFEPFSEPYREYVKEFGIKVFPDAQDFLDNWKDGYDEYMTEEEEQQAEQQAAEETGVVRLGMSDEELAKYFASKK
jgi:hypothetical protein